MEKKVGINQRISINVMEMAMKAALDSCFTPEYAADLVSGNTKEKTISTRREASSENRLFAILYFHI